MGFMSERPVAAGSLTRVLPDWRFALERPVSALFVKDRHPTPKVQAFLDFLSHPVPRKPSVDCGRAIPDPKAPVKFGPARLFTFCSLPISVSLGDHPDGRRC